MYPWDYNSSDIWGLMCQKQVSRTRTNNYISQIRWDVITCPCLWGAFCWHKSHHLYNIACRCYYFFWHNIAITRLVFSGWKLPYRLPTTHVISSRVHAVLYKIWFIESVSAFIPANNPGRSNQNSIWWRWHGNTKGRVILLRFDFKCLLASQFHFLVWFNRSYWWESTSMNIVWYIIMSFVRWSKQHTLVT